MRSVPLLNDQYYHLYNRGVNKAPIFFQQENWTFFLRRLRDYFVNKAPIISYCLMPNHYHLIIYVQCENFSDQVMQPFGVSYTKAINRQQNRFGPLFQGPFQAKIIEKDTHLLHLSRYIHMNPVSAGLVKRPENWEYSSYRDYIGLRNGTLPTPEVVLGQFTSRKAYAEFVCAEDIKDEILTFIIFSED